MKHFHMLMAFITLALFLYQAAFIISDKRLTLSRTFKGISHLIYLLLVASGLYLLWQLTQVAGIQHWAVAKIVLLIMAVSANIKALRPTNTIGQAKAGMMVAFMAYCGVIYMATVKPMLM